MTRTSLSFRIYIVMVVILALLGALNIFLPQGSFLPGMTDEDLPASKPVIALVNAATLFFVYGGLGYLGWRLSLKLGFADIWDPRVSNKSRFITPLITGVALGLFFILADAVLNHFHELGPLPHPPFPTSLVASAVAGIGEELIFRLFFISFWVWLISHVLLKKHGMNVVFWIFVVLSALVFALGHVPSVMMMYGFSSLRELPGPLWVEIITLNGILSLFAPST